MFKSQVQIQQNKFTLALKQNIEAFKENKQFNPLKVDFYPSINAYTVSIDVGQLCYTLETQKAELRFFKSINAILKAFPDLTDIGSPTIELNIA